MGEVQEARKYQLWTGVTEGFRSTSRDAFPKLLGPSSVPPFDWLFDSLLDWLFAQRTQQLNQKHGVPISPLLFAKLMSI